jgi:hypothetical protein
MRLALSISLAVSIIIALAAFSGQRGLFAAELAVFQAPDPKTGHLGQVTPGVPYVVRDGYGMQICVSSRQGHAIPPFIVPAEQPAYSPIGVRLVQPWVPFIVHDGYSTQVCVSSRGGRVWPPFVVH